MNIDEAIVPDFEVSTKNNLIVIGLKTTKPKNVTKLTIDNKINSMLDLNFLELFIKCNSLDHKNGATERLGSSKLKLIKYPEI